MKSWLRGKPRSILSFLVIAALVTGGMGWITYSALRLEREQCESLCQADFAEKLHGVQRERGQLEVRAREEYAAKLRLAMWRLDSRMAPVLAREDMRPYYHYNPVYAPSVVLDAQLNRCEPANLLEPSPLLNAELPDWMLLHFQTTPSAGWGSPQVLSATYLQQLTKNRVSWGNVTPERRALLTEMSCNYTSNSLLVQLQGQEQQFAALRDELQAALINAGLPIQTNNDSRDRDKNANSKDLAQNPGQNPGKMGESQRKAAYDAGYGERIQQRIGNSLWQSGFDESAYAVFTNMAGIGKGWPQPAGDARRYSEPVLVRMTAMAPVWLSTKERKEHLIVARRVHISGRLPDELAVLSAWPRPGLPVNAALIGLWQHSQGKLALPRDICQGILLDWPRLSTVLESDVRDLFPQARVVSMKHEEPANPERTMTTLPVELEPGPLAPEAQGAQAVLEAIVDPPRPETPVLGWTPLRAGLGLAWAAALVALMAVGLGGWSLIDLSERRIRFVSAVTHELRTPLTTLRLYLDMLTGGLVKDERQQTTYLETLNAETDRLNRLVNNVLDFSRLENHRPRLECATVKLSEFLDQVRQTWQCRCEDAQKQLIIENPLGDGAQLVTDVKLVEQILGTLIDNACKYTRGADDPRLWLRVCPGPANRLVLEVEDRGPGVPAPERRSIFRPFRRGGAADVTAGGVGLGLALAQRWTSLLDGSLTLCHRRNGVGACFRLELPVK